MNSIIKAFLTILIVLSATLFAHAQIGIGTTTPSPSAKLEVSSTTQGFLPPRMTTAQRNAISSPANGLIIYNTTLSSLEIYNGTEWGALVTAKTANYPGAPYRDLLTFSLITPANTVGWSLSTSPSNVLVFHQPANVGLSYISITCSSNTGSPETMTFGLYDMTGVFNVNAGGTLISTINTIVVPNNYLNTFEYTFATPFSSATGRTIVLRATTATSYNRAIISCINIGYSAL